MTTQTQPLAFQEDDPPVIAPEDQLVLDLDGFDGPIDLLLNLAREQKVDITEISILQLAEQYIAFIEQARHLKLEIAADYLVMAAWLAYLKSRLLVPDETEEEEEPTGEQLAEALQFQLMRLEAMQKVGYALMDRPRLGVNVFSNGAPEGLPVKLHSVFDTTLYDVLDAYGHIQRRHAKEEAYQIKAIELMSIEEALERLKTMLGDIPGGWLALDTFLPRSLKSIEVARSAVASMFGATLEMTKQGAIQVKQEGAFSPIYVRKNNEQGRK